MEAVRITAAEKVQFLCNKVVCTLHIKNGCLYLKCIKKLNALNPRPLSAYDKSIDILSVLSVTYSEDEWKINEKGASLLDSNFSNLLQTNVSSCFAVKVNLSLNSKNHCRKFQTLKLRTSDEKDCVDWCELIGHQLNDILKTLGCMRPQHLLVFVNPYGGKQNAESIHNKVVLPIFNVAGIKETLVITQYRNHAKNFVESADLSVYDGVVAVGGDGMLNEIMNGVIIAEQRKQGINMDGDSSLLIEPINYARPSVKVGIVPAGSTNCLSYVSQGKDDPETAALQIACGENHPLDVCSIHDEDGKFIRFSFSMTSYGYMGNVLQQSEKMRKFGPTRYDIAGAQTFAKLKAYSSEITYLPSLQHSPVDVRADKTKCRYPCKSCLSETLQPEIERKSATSTPEGKPACSTSNFVNSAHSDSSSIICLGSPTQSCASGLQASNHLLPVNPLLYKTTSSAPANLNLFNSTDVDAEATPDDRQFQNTTFPAQWEVERGNFMMVSSAMMSCACAKCPEGLSPSAHLADGNVDLILLRDVSRADFLRYLLAHTGKADRFNFPFVKVHRVKGFHHRALPSRRLEAKYDRKKASTTSLPITFQPKQDEASNSLKTSCWNTDGEIIEKPNITLWVHRGLVNIFAKGIENHETI